MRTVSMAIITFVILAPAPSFAFAQEDAMGFDEEPETPKEATAEEGTGGAPANEEDAFLAGEQTEEEKLLAAPEEDKDSSRVEDPSKPYFGVGMRLRWIMVPRWFLGMFGVAMKSHENKHLLVNNVGLGGEFNYRKDGFDVTAAIWYIGLNWDGYVSFKSKDDDENSWEVVENDLRGIMITVDFLWSTSFTDWLAIIYGAGIGLGIPFFPNGADGFLRTEATASSDHLDPCTGPTGSDDCNAREEYNEVYDVPTKIIPWINFLFGLRFKPHRHVAIYADAGFGIGFQTGLRAQYIF